MPQQLYDPAKVSEYRKAATKLHELSIDAQGRITGAVESGNIQSAHDALAELRASGEVFQELRKTLTLTDLFIAKYSIQVHDDHTVSFVLPQGVSRYEMLREAQGVVAERDSRDLVWPKQLQRWKDNDAFTATCTTPERIRIDGHVEGGDGMTRQEQEAFLKSKGLQRAQIEDLAAAFVAHWVATGEPLFGWYQKNHYTFWVRAVGGALDFDSNGLNVRDILHDASAFAVASRALPELKN